VVTQNEALNIQRRRQFDIAATLACDDAPAFGLEDIVLRNERVQHVRAIVALLSAADRNILDLRYFLSMSTTEIATHFRIPQTRVKRNVERAKWRLRNEMLRRGLTGDL
jgi:RNA polymerase sigma factor (sigma-70 family)